MSTIGLSNSSLIVSIHIPKTAGTTFGLILQEKYRGRFLYIYNTNISEELFCIGATMDELAYNQEYEQETAVTLEQIVSIIKSKNIQCVHGHVTYRSVAAFKDYFDKVSYVTWVRDPIARALSDFHHFLRNGYEGDHESLVNHTSNRMTDFIGNDPGVFAFIGRTENFEADVIRYGILDNYTSLNMSPYHEVDQQVNDWIYDANSRDIVLYQKVISGLIL